MAQFSNEKFNEVIDHLKTELAKLRTGRANPAMIEDVKVDYYGQPMPVKGIGSISVPEPRQLVIQPWDKNALQPIEKAIRDAGLGLNPTNEGDKLRITVPELTEERRKELTKVAGKIAEGSRVRVRNIREEILKQAKADEDSGKISEDEMSRTKEGLQKTVDDYNQKIKTLAETKEKEIMTI